MSSPAAWSTREFKMFDVASESASAVCQPSPSSTPKWLARSPSLWLSGPSGSGVLLLSFFEGITVCASLRVSITPPGVNSSPFLPSVSFKTPISNGALCAAKIAPSPAHSINCLCASPLSSSEASFSSVNNSPSGPLRLSRDQPPRGSSGFINKLKRSTI